MCLPGIILLVAGPTVFILITNIKMNFKLGITAEQKAEEMREMLASVKLNHEFYLKDLFPKLLLHCPDEVALEELDRVQTESLISR